MSDQDIHGMSRREVLRKSTVATVAGIGSVSAVTGSVSADSIGLPELRDEGVVLTSQDVDVPTDVRTGKRLLDELEANDLLEEASLAAVSDQQFNEDGQIHHTATDGYKQIAFTKSIPEGRLQITFSENGLPSASLFPKDGGSIVMFTAPDGKSYQRYESDLEVAASDDGVSINSCTDDNCDGCACEVDWCIIGRHKYKCLTCDDGECIITSSCGC